MDNTVEEEQARDRYLRRFGDRSQLIGSIGSASDLQPGISLLSPGILDPIQVPVPPPPSPEVPYISDNSALQHHILMKNVSQNKLDFLQIISYFFIKIVSKV